MAVIVGEDSRGIWAILECEARGCPTHIGVRPLDPDDREERDLLADVVAAGSEEGWALVGSAFCPDHAPRRRTRPTAVGSGFDWVNVVNVAR
jgi:hypothetical protein